MPKNQRASAHQRGYGVKWRQARDEYLRSHPWCVMCALQGRQRPATVVDHRQPHRGDQRLFWSQSNWQGLCEPHHNREKQALEASGNLVPVGSDGVPRDPRHPWAQQRLRQ